jgi:hypothetical protein
VGTPANDEDARDDNRHNVAAWSPTPYYFGADNNAVPNDKVKKEQQKSLRTPNEKAQFGKSY